MHFYIEDSLLYADSFFQSLGKITRFSGSQVTADDIANADVLLTRSTTKVNANLLSKADKLKFVGTATAGFNHIDTQFLAEQQIPWTAAPGCNAEAVADYVLSSALALAQKYDFKLADKTLGIIGVGQIGSRVSQRFNAIGCNVVECDPPRAERDSTFVSSTIEQVMQCDIITLHVPLIKEGPHKTDNLFDLTRLKQLADETILINACRGEVVDNIALKAVLQMDKKLRVVFDVWQNEPGIDVDLLKLVKIATPHIAGHSLEGKARGTEMLYYSVCQAFGIERQFNLHDFLPAMPIDNIQLSSGQLIDEPLLRSLTHLVYDVRNDDVWFRRGMRAGNQKFAPMRKSYPIRRELSSLNVSSDQELQQALVQKMGFRAL